MRLQDVEDRRATSEEIQDVKLNSTDTVRHTSTAAGEEKPPPSIRQKNQDGPTSLATKEEKPQPSVRPKNPKEAASSEVVPIRRRNAAIREPMKKMLMCFGRSSKRWL